MSGEASRTRALEIVREDRAIHQRWIDFLEARPDYPTDDVGDVEHHRLWISNYDIVLVALGDS